MKRFLLIFFTFVGLFSTINSTAQLFVSNNSYLFNKGGLVYVKGNIELNGANSNLYIRNEGQLLQGTTGVSTNVGLGKLSVFQEGTVNNYAYNYWCSPVGNASAASGNEDFGITMLNVPTTSTASTPATITSSSYNGVSSNGALTIASYWIWKFLSSTAYSQWFQSGATTNISAGQGFTMKGTSGSDSTNPGETLANNPGSAQRYDFRGKPNDGTITINVASGASTLTGNPYTSAIDLNSFLTDATNNAIDGTALFWEQDKTVNSHNIAQYRGGYGVYNGTTSVYTPATFYTYDLYGNQGSVYSTPNNTYQRRFSPIGQGFMVRGVANGSVQMKNSYRVYRKEGVANNSEFAKNNNQSITSNSGYYEEIPNLAGIDYTQISSAPTPHITINASLNGAAVRQLAICFLPTAVDGIDLADSKSPDVQANLPKDMYLYLGNTEYVQSTTNFEANKRFPVGFKTDETATFTIKVNEFVNFDSVNTVYLHDKLLDEYHQINDNYYELSLPAGVYNDRFEITFTANALTTASDIKDDFSIVQNNTNQLLSVFNPNTLDLNSVVLYDIAGKLVLNKTNLGSKNNYEFSTVALSEGIYIVKLKTTDDRTMAQKIIIKKVK